MSPTVAGKRKAELGLRESNSGIVHIPIMGKLKEKELNSGLRESTTY